MNTNEKKDLKISDLQLLNTLQQKASMLLNYASEETNNFYDFYFEKNLVWLLENQHKIEEDFNNNIDKLQFEIILNSDLEERDLLILKLKNVGIDEFARYVHYRPYTNMNTYEKNAVKKQFEKFKEYDDVDSLCYFEEIKR